MKIAAIAIMLSFLVGCGYQEDFGTIMGRSVTQPMPTQKIDCDLIFPAPAADTLAP